MTSHQGPSVGIIKGPIYSSESPHFEHTFSSLCFLFNPSMPEHLVLFKYLVGGGDLDLNAPSKQFACVLFKDGSIHNN